MVNKIYKMEILRDGYVIEVWDKVDLSIDDDKINVSENLPVPE